MKRTKLVPWLVAVLLLLGSWAAAQAAVPAGLTFTVTGYGDFSDLNPGDGHCDAIANLQGDQCSLRAAIEELNAIGPGSTLHQIEFDISVGTGPFTITPGSALPPIQVPVKIDGSTQPGASCPTANGPANLLIVLDGSNAGASALGLQLIAGSDGSIIRGLVIGNFSYGGIQILSDHNKVRCNFLGIGVDGLSNMGNGAFGVGVSADDNIIGGQLTPGHRNVVSWNNIGVTSTGDNNTIRNNLVGTTADGMAAAGNSYAGIHVSGNDNVVGGPASNAGNVISGNADGIMIAGDSNRIRGNYIGVAQDAITPLSNSSAGIIFYGNAFDNIIGGTGAGEGNLIANNLVRGVRISNPTMNFSTQNKIRGNIMFANGGLGIELGSVGVNVNDPGDGDTGDNELQNYPILIVAPGSYVVNGALDSLPNTGFTIDVYRNDSCDPTGYGEGQEHLDTLVTTTDGAGLANFAVDLTGVVTAGDVITTTATDPLGNTSEFSNCVTISAAATATPTPTYTSPPPTVTPTPTSTPRPTRTPTSGP